MSRLHSEERRSATALSTVGYSLVEEALAECLSCITKVCARARPPTVDCRAVLATLLSEHLLEAHPTSSRWLPPTSFALVLAERAPCAPPPVVTFAGCVPHVANPLTRLLAPCRSVEIKMGRMDRVYRPGVGFTPSDARHTLRPAAADQNRAQQQRSLQPCQAQTCLAQPARAPPATGHHQGGRGDQRARAFAHARGYQFARRGAGERIALAATALTTAAATISPTAFASTLSATILSIAAALSTAAAAAAAAALSATTIAAAALTATTTTIGR